MKNKKKGGKSVLIHDLMSTSLTARKAAKTVNVVFDKIIRALWRGEIVDIPGGSIRVNAREGKPVID
jgi:nucleoid DNA-binding protein